MTTLFFSMLSIFLISDSLAQSSDTSPAYKVIPKPRPIVTTEPQKSSTTSTPVYKVTPTPRPKNKISETPSPPSNTSPVYNVLPSPRPQYRDTYFYFFTKADGPAPILDRDQPMRNTYIPGDTLIRLKILPSKNDSTSSRLIEFETVPKYFGDPIRKGLIPMEFLGEEIGTKPTVENYERYSQALKVYAQKDVEKRKKKEKTISVQDALAEFHSENCARGATARTEDALKMKWESYIKNSMLTERGKQVAKNAMALDLTARTVLFESQRKESLTDDMHPKAIDCQWDLIALSIRNRAFNKSANSRAAYGAETEGDIIGAATDAQYNVWMKSFVSSHQQLLSCYLSPDYGDKKLNELYSGITHQIGKTIGIIDDGKPLSASGIRGRFALETNEKGIPTPSSLEDFTHYYHPKGMGSCNVNRRLSPEVSGYLRFYRSTSKGDTNDFDIFPLVNGKILGQNNARVVKKKKKVFQSNKIDMQWEEWDFDIVTTQIVEREVIKGGKKVIVQEKKTVQVPAETFFKGEVALVDNADLKESFEIDHYACLPDGILPQCYSQQDSPPSDSGYRVPYTWFQKPLRQEMATSLTGLGFSNAEKNFVLPKQMSSNNPSGLPIKVRCTSDEIKQENADNPLPVFGGPCDKNIFLASGIDTKLPTINSDPAAPASEETNVRQ
jgi:hypothetical protein